MYGLESYFGHDVKTSEAGAEGLLQVMPETRAQVGGENRSLLDRYVRGGEQEKQVAIGVLYYAQKLAWAQEVRRSEPQNPRVRGVSAEGLAAMAYNWGQGNMEAYFNGTVGPPPAETEKYKKRVEALVRSRQKR